MKETPVNKIMENTLEKMREMVDVSTIIGDPMVTGDTTLIPVSKVTYGFTSGGTDLPTKQQNQELFGGGGGMVLVPALHKFTDVEEDSLFPTSVAVIFPLCLVSLTVYGLHGDLPWQTAWPYLVGSALGGVAAGVFGRKVSTNLLHRILGILILWGGIRSFL